MDNFTPYSALGGGALIGLAATLLLWLDGRIAGISGILGGAVTGRGGERAWRGWFLAGLVAGAGIYLTVFGRVYELRQDFPLMLVALAGLLVGFGTALGSGCTSGHGVCGLARLSVRSLAATVTFLVMGIATTWLVRHVLGVGT